MTIMLFEMRSKVSSVETLAFSSNGFSVSLNLINHTETITVAK